MDAASYREALTATNTATAALAPASTVPDNAAPELAAAMREQGRAVPEELVVDRLVDDLARAASVR